MSSWHVLAPLLVSFAALLAGCGAGPVTATSSGSAFTITPGSALIDTNCTGCNAVSSRGTSVHHFSAALNSGQPANVTWSVGGGDPISGAGSINGEGQYRPPSYLTRNSAEVLITAALKSNPTVHASARLTLTPGFLQPLTPENVALGANGTTTITGFVAESGGSNGIQFALANTPSGDGGGQGTLGTPYCQRSPKSFTSCSVSYTAPATITSTTLTYVVASVPGSSAHTDVAVLLNAPGVVSNPATHQDALASPLLLGSSGGNNNDFDEASGKIVDCCSGTLGSLIQDDSGRQYLLSNNHILARSDHASIGDTIVQPGLIDNNCTPNGDGAGTVPVGTLSAWLPLRSSQTNADAAIAQVGSNTVDPAGSILELGARQADGTLAAAPLGTSSTNGKGEGATLDLRVAKSGRTTGLTCGRVTALDLDVSVDYYRDCAETRPYITKTFTHQIAVSGDRFSDAGDSGAIVVDAGNAEPVGLFFAGGIDIGGVSHAIASPARDVLTELSSQIPGNPSFSFSGTSDHEVSCLSYGDSTISAAQNSTLSDSENLHQQQAMAAARALVNPSAGILGIAPGKSSDQRNKAAVILYIDQKLMPPVPSQIDGVRTVIVPSTPHAISTGSAPSAPTITPLSATAYARAVAVKNQVSRKLMEQNPAFFAVGVGQSFDDPREAALVIFVDRTRIPAQLPSSINGLRARYIVMDRLHVTRSYATAFPAVHACVPHSPERLQVRKPAW